MQNQYIQQEANKVTIISQDKIIRYPKLNMNS